MAVTLYTDRRMIEHRVPGRHPERPERLQAILRHLERTGYAGTCPSGRVREATRDELLRVHEPDTCGKSRLSRLGAAARLIPTRGSFLIRWWPPGWPPGRRSRPSRT